MCRGKSPFPEVELVGWESFSGKKDWPRWPTLYTKSKTKNCPLRTDNFLE